MNFLQALGVSGTRIKFHARTNIFRSGDLVNDLNENIYLVETVYTSAVVLRKLNWWGRLLHKFGWLV